MFDIVIKEKPIVIDTFDVHTASNVILSYMVWMREGSYMNHELSPTYWFVVGCGEAQGYGVSVPTSLNPINEVLLDPSSIIGLYLTIRRQNDESIDGYMIYGVGAQSGSVHVQNEDLQILVGQYILVWRIFQSSVCQQHTDVFVISLTTNNKQSSFDL